MAPPLVSAARRAARAAVLALFLALVLGGCAGLDFSAPPRARAFPAYPETTFAVFSDPHLFLPELGIGQPGFEKTRREDRKLFEYSASLLSCVVAGIEKSRPSFVLVPGDLSKDGEEPVHQAFARAMEELKSAGIPVYVVPGNHDVNNPGALRFEGKKRLRVPTVSPGRFAEIYRDFGYAQAIERDPHSLAYVVEPQPGLWILAMDACRYDDGPGSTREHTGGALTPLRLAWLKAVLQRARREGKAVIAMMHHGVLEHFPGQKKEFPGYVVADNDAFSRMLAAYGVRVVFTGHFHAQNIAGAWWDDAGRSTTPPTRRFLYDIETGSLVTWPCPWRLVSIGPGQVMHVRSFRIESIPEMPVGFQDYAREYLREGMISYVERALGAYGVSKEEADRIAGPLAEAAVAHSAGDPVFRGTEMYPTRGLSLMGSIAIELKKDVIEGMWEGKPPHADNAVDIDLTDGTWRKVEQTPSGPAVY